MGAGLSYAADKLGPKEKITALQAQPDETYTFIIRFAEGHRADPGGHDLGFQAADVVDLPIINAIAAKVMVKDALALAGHADVVQVWYVHPDLADMYVRTISALQYSLKNIPPPGLVNISAGPPAAFWPQVPDIDDPMNAATRAVADGGLVAIVAIGNSGDANGSRDGWINPWCFPPWVICVGAYDGDKGRLASFSSRGNPKEPESWPDVVAQGVDVVGPYPTGKVKPPGRRQYDEGNARFRESVPKDKWDLYTLESGTSQAAANVTGAAAQIVSFLKDVVARQGTNPDAVLFRLTVPADRKANFSSLKPRLTGSATPGTNGETVLEYRLDMPWKMIKQLLVDTALPLPDEAPNGVGAGLVDRAYIKAQFATSDSPDIKLMPLKVLP